MAANRIRALGKSTLFIEELERPAVAQDGATTLAIGEECSSGDCDKKMPITTLAVGEECFGA